MGWWERWRLRSRLDAAEYLCKQWRWQDAERELREVLGPAAKESGPLMASARTLLAQTLRAQGRLGEAECEARAALEAQPVPGMVDGRDGQDVLALVLGDLGRHREAAEVRAATAAARTRTTSADHWLVLKGRSDRLQHLAYLGPPKRSWCSSMSFSTVAGSGRAPGCSYVKQPTQRPDLVVDCDWLAPARQRAGRGRHGRRCGV
ncbi:hypothetical protein QBC98_003233 [Kitasatospora acidiphila]